MRSFFAFNGKKQKIWPGKPYPLGATWDRKGVNFALFSENAKEVELCLFDRENNEKEISKIKFFEQTDMVWHAYLPEIQPGQLYGYRVYGTDDPKSGNKFNPSKLLLDPYAKAIAGTIKWNDSLFGNNNKDSTARIPKCLVTDSDFDWSSDISPKISWHNTIIYELHVKGFTKLNSKIPAEKRGTYDGLSNPKVLEYLKSLGITAVELMPIHHFVSEKHLAENGLNNYWGYNSIGYFSPDSRYSSSGIYGEQVKEFKNMVKSLHREKIEVILDVVYNHTGEGNHLGPTISFRGIDNCSYYRINNKSKDLYIDYTGCGNSLNMTHPRVLQLIMD
ncbi:MAG: alpha-amylase family glycosyl hydrolase, partial [Thermodesulfobacteriota bacterium]